MRMIDGQQLFAAFAHGALRGEQILGRGLVTDPRIGSDVTRAIDRLRRAIGRAAKQTTAFVRRFLARVGNDLILLWFCNR